MGWRLHQLGNARSALTRSSGEGVLAAEVGGRWSTEARDFLVALAAEKAREALFLLEPSVKAAWLFRWSCMLACIAARSFGRWWVVWPRAWTEPCRHCAMFCLRRGTCEAVQF